MLHSDRTHPVLVCFTGEIGDDEETQKKSNTCRRSGRKEVPKRKSRMRSKFMLEAVRQELLDLQKENEVLRAIVKQFIRPVDIAERILLDAEAPPVDIFLQSCILKDEIEEYEDKVIEKKADVENDRSKNEAKESSIPTVLTLPRLSKNSSEPEPERRESRNDFQCGEVESLAAALAGDFAF